jgi:hypothetical protein
MKQDDINLFEAYNQVLSSEREQLDEAGMLARAGTRLGALGNAFKSGVKAFTHGGSEGFAKTYQMGKQKSILSKIADETIKNIESLGLVPSGTKLSPDDKNELVEMLNKFIENRGGLSSTGQQGQALENPKNEDKVTIGSENFEFDNGKWYKATSGGSLETSINYSDETQKKITDAWRNMNAQKKKQQEPDFSKGASSSPAQAAKPAQAAAPKPAPKPFKLKPAGKAPVGKGPAPKPKAKRP